MALAQEPTPIGTTEYWKNRALAAEARADKSEERVRAIMAVINNKTLEERDRIATIISGFHSERAQQDREAKGTADPVWRPNPMSAIADAAGMGDDQVRASQKRLERLGLVNRTVTRTRDKVTGEVRSEAMIAREPDLNKHFFQVGAVDASVTPANTPKPSQSKPRYIDGNCPDCGSGKTNLKCRACGANHPTFGLPELKPEFLKPQITESENDDDDDSEDGTEDLKPQITERSDDEGDEPEEILNPQVAASSTYVSLGSTTPITTLPVHNVLTPQFAVSENNWAPQSFDPDEVAPEPPVEVAWWEIGQ